MASLGVLAVFYGVPSIVERTLIPVLPPIVIVLIGDLSGCVAIARVNPRLAVALYAGLTSIEILLLQTRLVSISQLLWIIDLVPALVLAGFAGVIAATREFAE